MKRKHLIISMIFVILIFFIILSMLLFYYIFACMSEISTIELVEDSKLIKNYILENEKNDNNLKTFIAIKEIALIDDGKDDEFYGVVLINTYNIENQLLEHNKSIKKLYKLKINFRKQKVISSDNLNIEDIDSYINYDIFPKNIISKYLQENDTSDIDTYLKGKIDYQIDEYYKENGKQNYQIT